MARSYNTEQVNKDLFNNGYAIIENLLSDEIINELKEQAKNMINNFNPEEHKTIFSTTNQEELTNDYFLNSSSKISFFFEPNAFNDDGNLKQDKYLSINKIGHALHDLDPIFNKFCRSDMIKDIINNIIKIESPLLVQSMFIYKQPRIGGEVTQHQDNWFIHTNPLSCFGLWFALEDATLENGCLYAVPGSHKDYPCQKRFVRNGNKVSFDKETIEHPPKDDDYIPLPVPKGSMVIIHGGLLHKSFSNTSLKSRQAFTMHIVDSNTEYSKDNWLQRPDMPFAGIHENPYLLK